jgi:hypothetical protein
MSVKDPNLIHSKAWYFDANKQDIDLHKYRFFVTIVTSSNASIILSF